MRRLLLVLIIVLMSFSVASAQMEMLRLNEHQSLTHGDQATSGVKSMTAPFKKHLFESFESETIPSGWIMVSNGNANEEWGLSRSRSHSGAQSAYLNYCSPNETMDEWLISPAVDLSGVPSAKLEFYEDEIYWANYGNYHAVKISTTSQTDLASFQTVLEMTPNDHNNNTFAGAPVEIDLSNFVGNSSVYIAFQYTGSDADRWYIDDVAVQEPDMHDVKAVRLNLNKHYEPGEYLQPAGQVQNVGLNAESFSVDFGYMNWDGTKKILDTKQVNNLAPGESGDVTFKYYVFPGNTQNTYFLQTVLPADMDSSNNVSQVDVNTFTAVKGKIMIEKATGTWCGFCPGSSICVEHLTTNYPDNIAVFEYHGGDTYENEMSRSRIAFYRITGYPTAVFNGNYAIVGGSSSSSWFQLYNMYHDAYLSGIDEKTGHSIDLEVTDHGNGKLAAVTNTKYEAVSLLKSYRLFYGLSESHIFQRWQDLDSLQHVARAMYPDQNGKALYSGVNAPTKGMVVTDSTEVLIPEGVVQENCHVIAFVQDMRSGEIVAVAKVALETPVVSSVEQKGSAITPESFSLSQNYPNPFNPETWIEFDLPNAGNLDIKIYNIRGQLVRTLASDNFESGHHRIQWNGLDDSAMDVVSGVYYIQADYLKNIETIKIVKLK